MDSYELAAQLMSSPRRNVTASVDVSTDDVSAHQRCFADHLQGVQLESDGLTLTLQFSGGYDNQDA